MKTLVVFVVLVVAVPTAALQRAAVSHATGAPVSPPPHEVARVNGTPVMSDRLDAALNALIPQESFHRQVVPERLAALRQQALNQLVDDELVYQDGVKRRIVVRTAEVDAGVSRAAKRYPSRPAFLAALARAGVTLPEVRREIRRTLTIEKTRAREKSTCGVTRAEAATYFAANPERFVIPEQLHVYAITIGVDPGASPQERLAAKAHAEEVLRTLQEGADFEETARHQSTDPSKASGGDMGLVHRGSLRPELEAATQGLARGGMTGVIQTIYGYHIVKIADILPPKPQAFDDAAADLLKDLGAKRCAEMTEAWLGQLRAAATIQLGTGQ